MANAVGRKKSAPVRRESEKKELQNDLISSTIPAAAYCRLSVKDDEEDSIENQIRIVQDHISSMPGLFLAETYVDNGLSGTDFKRPEWIRLMRDVRDGRINCIVVKDLSRFGRDYVEAGLYINNIFPKLGVRFIAISEGFDNTRADDRSSVMIAIRNIVNYAYAKDISRKIRKTMILKKQKGDVMGVLPFGYKKTEGSAEPDPVTAPVVKAMFEWTLQGADISDIAERLNLLRAAEGRKWTGAAVDRILSNAFYKGELITGKKVTRMKRRSAADESEWLVFKDHHEAIVSEEVFDRAQLAKKKRKRGRNTDGSNQKNHLNGILYCELCGRKLVYQRVNPANPTAGVYCYAHTGKNAVKSGIALQRRPFIREEDLYNALSARCGHYLNYLKDVRSGLKQLDAPGGVLERMKDQVLDLKEIRRRDVEFCERIYEDYAGGVLDADTFASLRKTYYEKIKKSGEDLQIAEAQFKQTVAAYEQIKVFYKEIFEGGPCFAAEKMISRLAERIELNADGTLNIRFRYQDTIKSLLLICGDSTYE